MATYKYLKPNPMAFTLSDGQEFILTPGKIFELPSENAYIRDLITQRFLEEVKQPEKPVEAPTSESHPKSNRSFKKR